MINIAKVQKLQIKYIVFCLWLNQGINFNSLRQTISRLVFAQMIFSSGSDTNEKINVQR